MARAKRLGAAGRSFNIYGGQRWPYGGDLSRHVFSWRKAQSRSNDGLEELVDLPERAGWGNLMNVWWSDAAVALRILKSAR